MSKYSDEMCEQWKDIKNIKEETKKIIEKGKNLALEEYHDAKSLERLKKEVMK